MIPESDIDRVLAAVDLVELVREYVPKLRKAGSQFQGPCIFHGEKTGSLTVHPSKALWKCHGCGLGGNPINFLMRAESISFPQAVRSLALRYGVTLRDQSEAEKEEYRRQQKLRHDAEWFWGEVMARYRARHNHRILAVRDIERIQVSTRGDWWRKFFLWRRYKRSTDRWGRIIARVESASRDALVLRYSGIVARHAVVAVAREKARSQSARDAAFWDRACTAVRGLDADGFNGLLDVLGRRLT
jgi:hypothetical protein